MTSISPPPPPGCRSCLLTDCPLFTLNESMDDTRTYLDCFQQIAGCDDDMAALVALGQVAPDTICEMCLKVLRIADAFRRQCQHSAKRLLERCQQQSIIAEDRECWEDVMEESAVVEFDMGNGIVVNEFGQSQSQEAIIELLIKDKYHIVNSPIEVKVEDAVVEFLDEDYLEDVAIGADAEVIEDDHQSYLCKECGIFKSSQMALRRHMLENHTPDDERPLFTCDICAKSYLSRSGIMQHMDAHRSGTKKELLCPECGQSFATNQRLRQHVLIHSSERIFACDLCDQRFTTDNYLQLHRRSHTDAPPLLHAARHVRRYECADCHLLFTASSSLRDHQRIHTGEKPYKCKLCPKSFAQSASLRFHMPIHVGNTIPCPDCDKKFSRPAYLRQHRLTHTGERPLQCPHCSAAYKQKGQLERHIDHSHPNVEHACKECDAVLATLSALKQHVKQAHVGGFVWRAKS